jgi:hypothetical protein
MADATMERSLAAAIDSTTATGTLIWLVPPQHQHQHQHQHHRRRLQEQEEPDDDDGEVAAQHSTAGGGEDVVASLLDDFIPRDSDLDERILECPTVHRAMLLAVASLRQEAVDLQVIISRLLETGGGAYRNDDGGFGAVPAAAAAVAGLRKRTFVHAAGVGDGGGSADRQTCCCICLEDFEDGEETSVMPCSGGHEFHSNCVARWLGQCSNMCPLCRHALPATEVDWFYISRSES